MNRLACAIVALSLVTLVAEAFAQDRTLSVREVDIEPLHAFIAVQPDGSCRLTATARVVAPSVEPVYRPASYPFNGARCTTVKNAIVTAAKKDLEVGDGSNP